MAVRRLALVGGAVMALVVVVLAVLSGFVRPPAAGAMTPAHAGDAFAALRILEDRVEQRVGVDGTWSAGVEGAALDVGDGVRTDAEGFAEVLYLDGSYTRLDGGALVELVRLDGDALAPIVTVRLDVGRTWHRVQGVTGERGAYEVETAVGTAAVRGTAFLVECDRRPVCTFSVLEGTIVVTTPDGRQLVVDADEELTLGLDDGSADGAVRAGDGPGGPGGGADGAPGGGGPEAPDGGDPAADGGGFPDDAGPVPTGDAEVLEVGRDAVPAGALAIRPFASANLARDRAVGDFGLAEEACAVTIDGRNVDLAATPDTAIIADVDDVLVVDALASGPLESYEVVLGLGPVRLPAASGGVEPGEDASRFRGTVDVGAQARWGTGLYRVDATTTGTRCEVTAFVDVRGGTPIAPILTAPGVLALVAGVASVAGLVSAIQKAGISLPLLPSSPVAPTATTSTTSTFTSTTKKPPTIR